MKISAVRARLIASWTFLLTLAGLIPLSAQRADPKLSDVSDIGSRRELFVDGFLVDQLKGKAELRLHHPVPQEIFHSHHPWEDMNAPVTGSVFKDGNLYRRYYLPGWLKIKPEAKTELTGFRNLCYEESDDGIHWRQPILELCEFQGSKANSIVVLGGTVGPFPEVDPLPTVFKDENPNAAADARYKAIFWSNRPKGLVAFKSPDGIHHWSPMSNSPIIIHVGGSLNLAFWDTVRGEYRAYFRFNARAGTFSPPMDKDNGLNGGRRDIRTATSKDFLTWSEPVDLQYGDSPPVELDWNGIMPYYRAPHLFIGFPSRFVHRRWSDSMRALPDRENRELRSKVDERVATVLNDSLVIASRDGVTFKRWDESFLSPGIERPGTWNWGQAFLTWHPVETKSALEGAPNELSFYDTENRYISNIRGVRRYTLRQDGFVSAQAPMSGGELVTKLLRFRGKSLTLNFATSAAGSVRVELQDMDGKPLSGFALEDCPPIFGDTIERTVTWAHDGDVSSISGQPVRLRFELRDADVYAFQFKE